MINDPLRLFHTYRSAEQGVDAGKAPDIIMPNQVAWAVNATMRGGFPAVRPGWRKLTLTGASIASGVFQGAHYFRRDISESIVMSVGGQQFEMLPGEYSARTADVREITISGDKNGSTLRQSWMVQAEDWLIVQDGQSRAIIYDGASSRRAADDEVPVGTRMAYGNGRLWVSRGREFEAGDIVGGSSGTAAYNRRDAVLKFTENDFLNEGGAFAVPMQSGDITGLAFASNLDTALGDSQLIVFTRGAVYAVNVPADRTTWKDLTNPVQRVALLGAGARAHNSIVNVNSDIFFRSDDGIRSLILARRDFGDWGQVPVSREMNRLLPLDDRALLGFGSGVQFDNRLLITCSPVNSVDFGVWHRGLVALDFNLLGSMTAKLPPAYEGVWTGLRVLQVLKGQFREIERCFLICLGDNDAIELWEQTLDLTADEPAANQRTPIVWEIEYGSGLFGDGGDQLKRLMTGDIWIDQISGNVNLAVDYRPDQYPTWQAWHEWTVVAEECPAIACSPSGFPLKQYRTRRQLPQPPDSDENTDNKPMRLGYQFQPKLTVTGAARIKKLRLHAEQQPEFVDGSCPEDEDSTVLVGCPDDPFTYQSDP